MRRLGKNASLLLICIASQLIGLSAQADGIQTAATRLKPSPKSRISVLASSPGAVFKHETAKLIDLDSGSLIIDSGRKTSVTTPSASISCKRPAIVYIQAGTGLLRVQNLSERAKQSVFVAVQGRSVEVAASHELIVTPSTPSPSVVASNKFIGHRNVASEQISTNLWLTTSEVYAVDVQRREPLLASLRRKPGIYRQAMSRFVKRAVTTAVAKAKGEPFPRSHKADPMIGTKPTVLQ